MKTLLLTFFLVLLVSCGGGSSNSPSTNTNNNQNNPTPTPTATPSSTPEPTPTPTPAPTTTEIPNGGTLIIDPDLSKTGFWGGSATAGGEVGSQTVVAVDHPDFSNATRIEVNAPRGDFWNGQLQFPTTEDLQANDIVLIHFYFRSIANTEESGASFVTVFLENADTEKYATRVVTATADWQEYFIPAVITEDEARNQIGLRFGFGAGVRPQTFDIAGVELFDFGTSVSLDELPITRPSYEGRAADASWRAEANARIEQHRKGDFQLNLQDSSGNAITGANLEIKFKKHAYHFGSVTVGHILAEESDNGSMYREKVLELFNQSGPENDLKWAPWEGEWGNNFNQTQTIAGLQWLRDNGLYTRGHVMVWPSKRNLPNLIQNYLPENDPNNADPAVQQIILDHIDDITQKTAHVLDEWDVLNEPYDNHYLMDAFGNQVMVDWFNQARTNLSSHGLYINDYAILSSQGRNFPHQQHYQDTIQYLVDNNAPITGIGMQGHFSDTPTAIETVYSIVDRFATAFPGLSIRTTEFDVSTEDEALQADYTRDFLTIFFSHPATVGVQCWGFWEGAHWRPSAAMYDENWREKPNALAWKELIFQQWWNDFSGQTDTMGQYSNRGFYGEYEVSVTVGTNTKSFIFTLEPGQSNTFNLVF